MKTARSGLCNAGSASPIALNASGRVEDRARVQRTIGFEISLVTISKLQLRTRMGRSNEPDRPSSETVVTN
jgi:hypothetical protein